MGTENSKRSKAKLPREPWRAGFVIGRTANSRSHRASAGRLGKAPPALPRRAGKLSVDLDAGIVAFQGETVPLTDSELAVLQLLFVRAVAGRALRHARFGPLTISFETQQASIHGRRLVLTYKEFAVLQLLALQRDRPVSKATLFLHLYGERRAPNPKIIDVYLCRLRRKLAKASGGRNFILTRRGQGYLLTDPDEANSRPVPAGGTEWCSPSERLHEGEMPRW